MAYAVGIDLGTTNSVVSVYRRGVAETLLIKGRTTMPSVISFREEGDVLIGQAAKSRMLIDPENTIFSSKRFMGDRSKSYRIRFKTLTPVNIASMILKQLVESAQSVLGGEVWDAVITVPAYFTEAQREDTKKAGEEAGLNVLRLLPEPTAAAIAYGLDKERDQTIMVYDLGGGTFDVSILEIRGNNFNVKAVGGDSRLGGDDFDQAIITWAAAAFRKKTGIDVLNNHSREGRIAQQRLKEAAESAKIELSESDSAFINLPDCLGHPLSLEISLAEYNRLIDPFLQRTIQCMKAVLRDANLTPRDIDRVILVGGSTKNKAVREVIAQQIKDPYIADRVDEVVSHGASIVAANLFLPAEEALPIEISDVTGHSLGIDALNEHQQLMFRAIIPRQTSYPCRGGFLGSTGYPNQPVVKMRVFRGEQPNPLQNYYLGEIELPISPPQENLVPVGAIFELDADGIIHFTAVQFPISEKLVPIINYAAMHNGDLDLATVDDMLRYGDAKSKTVQVRMTT